MKTIRLQLEFPNNVDEQRDRSDRRTSKIIFHTSEGSGPTADMFNKMKKKKKKILRKFILALFPSIEALKLLICDLFDKRETDLNGINNEEAAARYILSIVTSYKKFLKYLKRDNVKDKSDEESDSDDPLSSDDSMLEGVKMLMMMR